MRSSPTSGLATMIDFAERMKLRRARRAGVCLYDEGACSCTGEVCPRRAHREEHSDYVAAMPTVEAREPAPSDAKQVRFGLPWPIGK